MWPGSNQAEPAQRVSERRGGGVGREAAAARLNKAAGQSDLVFILCRIKSLKESNSASVSLAASRADSRQAPSRT